MGEISDDGRGRVEMEVDGGTALLAYRVEDDTVHLTHTEVPVPARGRGIGGRLARHALEDARRRGRGVVPSCPFVAAYIRRNPEFEGLVVEKA
jgi:uncharacterized protein